MTQTVGKGKSKGMAKGRQAKAKADANADRVAQMNAAARPEPEHKGEWLTTKHVQPGTWVAQAVKGRPANGPTEYRQVAEVTNEGSMRKLTFTDGTSLVMGTATKVFVAPATDGYDEWAKAQGLAATVLIDGDEVVVSAPEPAPEAPQAATDPVERLALAKAEHKALQVWIKAGENPPRPATPNLDAVNADHAARGGAPAKPGKAANGGAKAATAAREVPADHPLLRYVDEAQVGKRVPAELELVATTDATGLVRVHKAKCKPAQPALKVWPERVYAAACCKPRTPGAVARTTYVPPSKRQAAAS